MARNRKNNAAIRFVPALKALIICLLLGSSSVGYVLQKNKIYELGREINDREKHQSQLQWENAMRAAKLKDLLSPPKLQLGLKKHRLELELPQPAQIIWLPEPSFKGTLHSNEGPRYVALGDDEPVSMVK